jgi:ribosomal protein L37AE/L43A
VNKISEIFQAWVAAANPTPEQTLIAEHRSAICDVCPHKAHNKAIDLYYCGKCGCPLAGKVFSPRGPEACPDNRWIK